MKRQILRYNHLVSRYNRYRRKLQRIRAGESRYQRVEVLIKRVKALYTELSNMRSAFKTAATAAAVVGGIALSPISLQGQSFEMRTDVPTRHALTEANNKPVFADVDGDGDMDLFIGGKKETTADVIYNRVLYFENSNGVFSNAVSPFPDSLNIDPMLVDTARVSPAFVDYDMDGDPDCFIGLTNGTMIYYRNDDGQMVGLVGADNPFDGIDLGDGNASPTFLDVDGDGDMDAVIGKEGGDIVYYENVDGVFTDRADAENPFDAINVTENAAPTFADLDGDGDMDLFVGNKEGVIQYYENDGGVWTANPGANPVAGIKVTQEDSAPVFADIDDDGDLDLWSGQGKNALDGQKGFLSYYENDGASNFTFVNDNQLGITRIAGDINPGAVDADGDGDMDAFFGLGDGKIDYFRNDEGTFVQQDSANNPLNDGVFATTAIAAPAFADLDNDGDDDAYIGTYDENIVFLENDGGVFTRNDADNPFAGIDPGTNESVAFADYDNDGDLDAFVGLKDGSVKYYRNDGTADAPVFVEAAGDNPFDGVDFTNTIQPNFVTTVSLGDLDGDGDVDALVGQSIGTVRYFANEDGVLTEREDLNPLSGYDFGRAAAVDLSDIDGDGDADLLLSHSHGGTYYFENTGTTGTVDPVLTQMTSIFPNPTSDQVTLEIPWSNGEALVELVNLSGKVMFTKRSYKLKMNFNVNDLPSGMYFVRVSGEEGVAVKSFVKQ